MELDPIDCEIHYIPGKENVVPDFLSRDIVDTFKTEQYELDYDDLIYAAEEPQQFDIKQQQKQDEMLGMQ